MSDVAFVVGKHAIAVHRSAAGIRGGRFGVFSAQGESRQQQKQNNGKQVVNKLPLVETLNEDHDSA